MTFDEAQVEIKKLTKKPTDKELLSLYALFKQATDGDVQGSRPGMIKIVARAKYDACAELAGTTSDEAQAQYVVLVQELLQKISGLSLLLTPHFEHALEMAPKSLSL